MNEFDQGGGPRPTDLIEELIARYKERALPCLAEAMHDPEAWAMISYGKPVSPGQPSSTGAPRTQEIPSTNLPPVVTPGVPPLPSLPRVPTEPIAPIVET